MATRTEETTMTYICIARDGSGDVDTYPTNTAEEIAVAEEALRAAGLESAPVYAGEPDGEGDSYKNGDVLFARMEEV